MSFNGLAASFLPFTINGLTDATFSSSNIGDAIATTLQLTSATPLTLARFNADRELVSASVDESEVALLVGNNTFKGSQTILPGSTTNINNVITTAITAEAYTEADFTTSGISGYTPPLGTLSGPNAGEYSISQTANDRSVMRINGFVPTVKTWVYTFMIRIVDTAEGYLSVEQSGVQRSSTLRLITPELTSISDTFTYDPTSGPIVFKIYTGSLDPWSASWSSFTLGSYTAAITAPLSAPLIATTITTSTISTQILSFPSISSVNSESWSVYAISTMGNPSSLGGLIFQESTLGVGAYITGGVVGATSFRFNTLSGNAGKVVVTNGDQVMSTSISAGQLDYITGLTSQAGGIGQANTWTGANVFTGTTSVGALRVTSSGFNVDYSVSVNSTDFLEFTNLLSNQKVYTDGDSFWIPNRLFCNSTVYAHDLQMGSTIYFAYGTGQQWGTNLNGSGEYEIQDDVGDTRLKLSKSTGLTVSTLNVTSVPSATPTLALGINGSGGLVSFVVPSAGGTVNTSTTTARFLPYLSTANTLTNSLLNQIDNDSMGFGYTTIPNYPLGSGGKNMYINGSIFAGALNSMYATFGRDTNTSNPANEITFTTGGAGVLLTQVKSHSGSSPFVDATWTYSNTNPAPLGANQGQVLLTADKLSLSNELFVTGDFKKQGGNSGAHWFGIKGTDTFNSPYLEFFVGSSRRSYIGYATTTSMNVFSENGANLQLGTEGVTRMVINTAGDVVASNNLTANCLVVNGGGTYQPGCLFSDGNYGMLFRARQVPAIAHFAWFNSAGTELMRLNPTNELLLTKDGPGFVQTNGTITVESYVGGSGNGGWYGTRTNHPLMFYTNNASAQMTLKTDGSMTHTTGDNSYMRYGPNSTWSASLVVGATPDRSGAGTAQVITTNGNIHIDAGNSTDIYYGYYANARGTPNVHRFFGGDYNFVAVPQNFDAYAHVCVFAGDQMRRSQCMMRQIYRQESIAWTGGVNMTYAFYKYNAQCPVKISGKYSMYSTYVGIQNVGMRLYSQTSGAYFYYNFRTYQNITIAQTTYPFELILTAGDLGAFSTGWFDFYIYGVAGQCQSDVNNQLHVCVQVLPVSDF